MKIQTSQVGWGGFCSWEAVFMAPWCVEQAAGRGKRRAQGSI